VPFESVQGERAIGQHAVLFGNSFVESGGHREERLLQLLELLPAANPTRCSRPAAKLVKGDSRQYPSVYDDTEDWSKNANPWPVAFWRSSLEGTRSFFRRRALMPNLAATSSPFFSPFGQRRRVDDGAALADDALE